MATAEQLKIQVTADNQASAPINKLRTDIEKLDKSGKSAAASLAASNGKLTGTFSKLGSGAGRAGIQVQQFVGQVQGGTNPMLALSQQATDLGFVLGFPLLGAVAGLGASLAMSLIPSIGDTGEATAELIKEIDELKGAYDELTESTRAYYSMKLGMAITELANNMAELEREIRSANSALIETEEAADPMAIGATADETARYTGVVKDATPEIITMNFELDQKRKQLERMKEQLSGVATGTKDMAEADKKAAEESQKLIESLKEQQATFGFNTEQKQRYKILNMPEQYRAEALAIHDNILTQQAEKTQFEETEKAKEEIRKSSIEGFNKLSAQNKKLFQVQKAYNIANAIMDTYTGANKALALYPPPLSYAMAAGQIALGMANVATIKSQTFSGRAVGGRVEAGTPYMVGEQGREMFIPSTRGEIVKNSDVEAMGSSGGAVNVSFTINAVDTRGFDELLTSRRGQIVNMVNQAMNDRGRAGVV
jgi:hypothetical protein